MMDEGEEAYTCVFTSALKGVPWSQFGHKLTLSESGQWSLRSIFPYSDENRTKIHRVRIVANLCSNSGKSNYVPDDLL